ncbi:MAG: hypothetical protein ABIJ96_13145 [Elusimicrobiota bacterium]
MIQSISAYLSAAVCFIGFIFGWCENRIDKTIPSPDGSHVAATFWRSCGSAAGAPSFNLSLSQKPPKEGADLGDGGNVIGAVQCGDLKVSWNGSRALNVDLAGGPHCRVLHKSSSINGVSISFTGTAFSAKK